MLDGKKDPNEYVIMEMLSQEYGWTPEEIRSMRLDDLQEYVAIIRNKRAMAKHKSKKK